MFTKTMLDKALHAKSKDTRRVIATLDGRSFVGTAYALFDREKLTAHAPKGYAFPEGETLNASANDALTTFLPGATARLNDRPCVKVLSIATCYRLAADLYVNEDYLDLLHDLGWSYDSTIKGGPVIAKHNGKVVALVMPVSIKDCNFGIQSA